MVKPQAGPLPSRDQDHADLPGREGLVTPGASLAGREAVLGGVQPEGRGLPGPQGQIAKIALVLPLGKKLLDQREINAADLPGQRLALLGVQLCPEGQQVFLPEGPQDC